jgi:hypothetical protein
MARAPAPPCAPACGVTRSILSGWPPLDPRTLPGQRRAAPAGTGFRKIAVPAPDRQPAGLKPRNLKSATGARAARHPPQDSGKSSTVISTLPGPACGMWGADARPAFGPGRRLPSQRPTDRKPENGKKRPGKPRERFFDGPAGSYSGRLHRASGTGPFRAKRDQPGFEKGPVTIRARLRPGPCGICVRSRA